MFADAPEVYPRVFVEAGQQLLAKIESRRERVLEIRAAGPRVMDVAWGWNAGETSPGAKGGGKSAEAVEKLSGRASEGRLGRLGWDLGEVGGVKGG